MLAALVAAPRSPSPAKAACRTCCRAPMPRWSTCHRRRPAGSSSRCTSTTRATPRQPFPLPPALWLNQRGRQHARARRGLRSGADGARRRDHYSVAAFLPYSGSRQRGHRALGGDRIRTAGRRRRRPTFVPVLLAWKDGDLAVRLSDAGLAPTGSYKVGRLGNTGLNYWTFDPNVGGPTATRSRASTRRSTSVTR